MWSYRTAFIFKTFHELFNDCQFLKLTTRKFVRYCKYLPVLPSTCLLWNLMWYFAGELCLQMFEIKGLFLSAMYFSRYNLFCVSACLNISMTMILTCKPIHCMYMIENHTYEDFTIFISSIWGLYIFTISIQSWTTKVTILFETLVLFSHVHNQHLPHSHSQNTWLNCQLTWS